MDTRRRATVARADVWYETEKKGRRTFEKHGGFMSFVAVGLQGVEDDMDGARSICCWIWIVYLRVH